MMNSVLLGVLLGATICIMNIKWLRFFVNGILLNMKNIKGAQRLTYISFIFRYLVIAGILYLAVISHVADMLAIVTGFSAALFSVVLIFFIQSKRGININGRTTPLY
ncbi:MAG TPA: hypothetical protein DCQ99_04030 [Nitrospinae bacterium]|nr:hypothetical protein [Nitrospinota bacterium]HBA26296.1 hypothetical protein [Nitrospinota bacterium]